MSRFPGAHIRTSANDRGVTAGPVRRNDDLHEGRVVGVRIEVTVLDDLGRNSDVSGKKMAALEMGSISRGIKKFVDVAGAVV